MGMSLMYSTLQQKHRHRLEKLATEMDMHKAVDIVRSQGNASADVMNLVQVDGTRTRRLRHQGTKVSVVATDVDDAAPNPAKSVKKAVNMLNEMIYKCAEAYDKEITKCCAYKTQS